IGKLLHVLEGGVHLATPVTGTTGPFSGYTCNVLPGPNMRLSQKAVAGADRAARRDHVELDDRRPVVVHPALPRVRRRVPRPGPAAAGRVPLVHLLFNPPAHVTVPELDFHVRAGRRI